MMNFKLWMRNQNKNIYWYFNIDQEQRWNESKVFPSVTDSIQLELAKQQEQQLLFVAESKDTVILHKEVDSDFVNYLNEGGFISSKFITLEDKYDLGGRLANKNALLVPFINSEEMHQIANQAQDLEIFGCDHQLVKSVNNKINTKKLVEEKGFKVTKGYFCKTLDELKHAYTSLTSIGFEKCIIKIPYGSSGKGLKIIDSQAVFVNLCRYISRRNSSFDLLIEGWHPIEQNINCQLFIANESIEILSITEQRIDHNAVYIGTNYNPNFNNKLIQQYRYEMQRLGTVLKEMGYRGIAGIDSIVDKNGELYPVIEINARFTQVTYMLPVIQKINYPYIESRFIRFNRRKALNFKMIKEELDRLLMPDQNNKYIIYTFARKEIENKTWYRIFVLFYGENYNKIKTMLNSFQLM